MYSEPKKVSAKDYKFDLEKIEALREEMDKHTIYDGEHIIEQYNGLAATYDQVMAVTGFPDPSMYPQMFEKLNIPKDAEILDMGCGTGEVGKFLTEAGYTRIAGIDA